jgi:hypothetical protein
MSLGRLVEVSDSSAAQTQASGLRTVTWCLVEGIAQLLERLNFTGSPLRRMRHPVWNNNPGMPVSLLAAVAHQ